MDEIDVVQVKCPECGTFTYDQDVLDLTIGDYCIVENPYDENDVVVGQIARKFKIERQKSTKSTPKVMRKATPEDKKTFEELKLKEEEAHNICWKKIRDHKLPMKLIKSHYYFDGSKITFYFTADKRVDFRALVKDLAYIFKRRIELRQIGPRDEAKMIGGVGCCGQKLCCTSFLKNLGKVHMKMAKEQNITLTPSKISGICGKLLCCFEYEREWYQQARKTMPQIGAKIEFKGVKYKVEDLDPFHGTIKVKDDDGNIIEVNVEDIKR
ncbi:TPA: stage 0 sporulation protein [bacterium]|nr:stage 0 sporulation protein [bacterium]